MAIANSIGKFILIKYGQLLGFERSSSCMLVDLDLYEGLLTDLEVIWNGRSFV